MTGAAAVLAVDQGTTNTKAILVDEAGRIVAAASRPVAIAFPEPGWVQQDAEELWRTAHDAMADCVAEARGARVAAVAITNQRETTLVWDRRTGRPLGPAIVWQCRRTMPFCAELRRRGLEPLLARKTGLTIDPLFSASKMRWLLDAIPDGHRRAVAGDLCVGTVDSWLLWHLTGGRVHACDATNASRTQLYDLHAGAWDDELLGIFGIPRAALPDIRPSSHVFGETTDAAPVGAGVPIASLAGDSHAALFGHAAFQPGAVKATYGTGSSLMSPTAAPISSSHGLSTTIAWATGTTRWFALEGNITMTGGAIEWLGGLFGAASSAAVAEMAESVADPGGVYVVPAFAGLGAPHWDDRARGLITGLTRGTSAAEIARATVDAVAYQVSDVFEAMSRDAANPMRELLADGGASRNDALMQFQADIIGRPVIRDRSADVSALGAAWLAGLAIGLWNSTDDLTRLPRATDRFEPRMDDAERERRLAGWREAVARARFHGADGEAS